MILKEENYKSLNDKRAWKHIFQTKAKTNILRWLINNISLSRYHDLSTTKRKIRGLARAVTSLQTETRNILAHAAQQR